MKQAFFLIPTFSILALLQTSFLAHFTIQGLVFPIVMIAVFILSVFQVAFFARIGGAFAGGALLDVFSQHFFGYWVVILVLISCVVSFVIHTYARLPLFKKGY